MKIILVNDCGCLISEEEYDDFEIANENEALELFLKDNVVNIGDTIQIRE